MILNLDVNDSYNNLSADKLGCLFTFKSCDLNFGLFALVAEFSDSATHGTLTEIGIIQPIEVIWKQKLAKQN